MGVNDTLEQLEAARALLGEQEATIAELTTALREANDARGDLLDALEAARGGQHTESKHWAEVGRLRTEFAAERKRADEAEARAARLDKAAVREREGKFALAAVIDRARAVLANRKGMKATDRDEAGRILASSDAGAVLAEVKAKALEDAATVLGGVNPSAVVTIQEVVDALRADAAVIRQEAE